MQPLWERFRRLYRYINLLRSVLHVDREYSAFAALLTAHGVPTIRTAREGGPRNHQFAFGSKAAGGGPGKEPIVTAVSQQGPEVLYAALPKVSAGSMPSLQLAYRQPGSSSGSRLVFMETTVPELMRGCDWLVETEAPYVKDARVAVRRPG